MADRRRWLARHRVRLGFAAAAAALWLARPTMRSIAVGGAFAVIGEALRVWAAGHLEKGKEVTVSGPYRITRHPLYAGSVLLGIGLAIAAADAIVAVIVLGYLAVTITSAVRSEERHLTEQFGETYAAYRDGRAPAVGRAFSVRRAVANREYRAVGGLLLVLALLILKAL